MFLTFQNDEEREEYGGTAFIEIKYCRLPEGTNLKKILNNFSFWEYDNTLFVYTEDMAEFSREYRELLGKAVYNNLSEGLLTVRNKL